MEKIIFFPFDPDGLVDQLKLLYFEKVGGSDNPMLNEQIIALQLQINSWNMNLLEQTNTENLQSTFGNV